MVILTGWTKLNNRCRKTKEQGRERGAITQTRLRLNRSVIFEDENHSSITMAALSKGLRYLLA